MSVHVFGIRHHGPGSARSLGGALEALSPEVVLIEGPPQADALLPLAAHPEMRPPVAILVYDPATPHSAVSYPVAVFSPEWQAIRFALERQIPVRFIDLPPGQRNPPPPAGPHPPAPSPNSGRGGEPHVAGGDERPEVASEDAELVVPTAAEIREDPLDWLARASGHADGERWWEEMIEQRRSDEELFAAVLEAMTALRDELALPEREEELRREAFMRQQIRAAEREGFERIAVVCGAWHAPALTRMPPARADQALLKGLPKSRMIATWIPWTYGRLTTASGYGAGVGSPGWYDHLWRAGDAAPELVTAGWLTRVAQQLREEELDASPAQVIDAARLAESLAALRGRPLPGLPELNEAAEAVFWSGAGGGNGAALPLRLIHERLIVDERLGQVPTEAPAVPLQQDLAREQKRLRLPPEAAERLLELDLRRENDRERSQLLHRLHLLGVPWGVDERTSGKKGTFHERWRLRWLPEYAVALIEASVWGNTVAEAAAARVRSEAERATELPALTAVLDRVLLAELPEAARYLITRIDAEAARASDTLHLMHALPPLARVLRYGNVRRGDTEVLSHVVDALVARIGVGLPVACASLDDDAAAAMLGALQEVHGAVTLLDSERHRADWTGALLRLGEQSGVHGLVAGRAVRLLFELEALDAAETARRTGLALSPAADPAAAGAWVEGFLSGSGLVLLHDATLWGVLDGWIARLAPEAFTNLLPLLRRTFATFPLGERRMLGERARRGAPQARAPTTAEGFDTERAEAVLPLLAALLGVEVRAEVGRR